MEQLSEFTGLYPLSKTLRFELKPQGRTLEHINECGFLEKDEHRAESYIAVKKIIDEYHKEFISKALNDTRLDSLDEYFSYYQIQEKTEDDKKIFELIQTKLRKQIANQFTKDEGYKNLFAKELIKQDLQSFVKTEEDLELVKEFETFTTYFTGFHENRKNMYDHEEKSTAIAYRLIHQNLPKFIDNMRIFEKITNTTIKDKFQKILEDDQLGPIVQVNSINEVFALDYFNDTLTQMGIDKYNHLLGGFTAEDGKTKIQGLNEYINLYNQQVKEKKDRIGKLKPLYKQILSDRSTVSFLPEEFKDDADLLESIEKMYQELMTYVFEIKGNEITTLPELIQSLNDYDLNKIYLKNDLGLTDISQKMFGNWGIIQQALNTDFDNNYTSKIKKDTEKYEEEQKKYFKRFDSFSIQHINECLMLLDNPEYHNKVEDYYKKFSETVLIVNKEGNEEEKKENFFVTIEKNYKVVKDILNAYDTNKNLAQDQESVSKIKYLLDSIKAVQWFVKPLLGKGNEPEKDEKFYGELTALWTTLDQITPLYNKVRNYMTRKPYSTEKIKLNFESSTLLDGWDVNKEDANNSIIFIKNGKYYLGIMNKKHNRIFKRDFEVNDESYYEKMEYKLLPGANKMLPKVFFSKSRIDEFAPSKDLMERYGYETHKKGETFNLNDCHNLIDFFKASINKHEDWKNFNFHFSDTKSYEDLSGFYREVEQQGYKITFRKIPESYINQMVDEGKLYLFQIYNKDFSEFSNGTPNMHTLYWKMLFDPENLKDVVYKLNGQAEVFYRKSSINKEDIITHKANNAIDNKNTLSEKKQSKFEYDIIKDRRFSVDKFQFHVPITMNFKAAGLNNINAKVNQFLKEDKDIHIIGLDRGERHLIYLTLIDMKGNIKEQFTLNDIINEHKGFPYVTNYRDLLDKKEKGIHEAKKSWKTIENIKELKEGYLSQVIHKISELMIKYNAIVVLEDLNMGFMRGRQKVEKQVYQKFEKMLIDKLNYLVDKKKPASEKTGTLKALQLTNKFESFQKMGKQSGFLFYVPAWNTSKMDPVTGFVNLFYAKYENVEKAQKFFGEFDSIAYNPQKNYFEFAFDYEKFTNKAEGTRTKWTLCTYGNRIETFRNTEKNSQWDNKEVNLTNEFITLFKKNGIDYKTEDLKKLIVEQSDKKVFEPLLHLFKLTLQMRNSITGTDTDYLISPVANEKGEFYDSSIEKEKGKDINKKWLSCLPVDADANGAYNIARKGLWVIEQVKQAEDLKKIKLAITNKEWLHFAQTHINE